MAASAHTTEEPQKPASLPNCKRAPILMVNHHHPKLPLPAAMHTTQGLDGGKWDSLLLSQPPPQSCLFNVTIKSSIKNSKSRARGNKSVRWDKIHTREFHLVVGDHPMCQDGLPLSLGWKYDDYGCQPKKINSIPEIEKQYRKNILSSPKHEQIQLSERWQSYAFPRRLSYEERRERLIYNSDLTLDQIKNDENNLVVRTWNQSWDNKDSRQLDRDILMTPVQLNHDVHPIFDDDLMELEDIHIDHEIDLINEDFGDITNFEWIDRETNGISMFDSSPIT
eukprot:CAMPEP_0197185426 /NCGR_PEP_ID=MMETSP1423-20130617/11888_1 /TAXON_ID=476441 /ORGANISM="Pseudo-nitzschia heimii, Strain UNC1101" /LENGTH=279 /DNA_ID=CAMNT_0042636477 /DNA_START=8 /DNA_END=847 /DNA_ORIENTATION=+